VFKNEPPSAANRAQDQRTVRKAEGEDASYLTSVKNLMLNPGYVLLLFTYGMNVGVFYAISTLLSTTVVQHFEVISDEFSEDFFLFPR
jgi:FLVCR family feline leukemia virus subgroup C receptor-related protein